MISLLADSAASRVAWGRPASNAKSPEFQVGEEVAPRRNLHSVVTILVFALGIMLAADSTAKAQTAVPNQDAERLTLLPADAALDAWEGDNSGWTLAGGVMLDPADPGALKAEPGDGVLISTLQTRAKLRNLASRQLFADVEVHVEFLLPKDGNAGVKLQGLYELQITDSYGKKKPTADDCGGIYPRAELLPCYHTIDDGIAPLTNAAKRAGEWQSFDIVFQAPRFDADGKKTANARFLRVLLNDKLIHKNVELKWPTGHAWRTKKEVPVGPLFLQGDHGPIAYRNIRVRPITPDGQ